VALDELVEMYILTLPWLIAYSARVHAKVYGQAADGFLLQLHLQARQ
jgi:hypothetical protein